MSYWWTIKRYGDEPIRVTEKVAQQVIEAKTRGDGDVLIPKHGLVAVKAISGIEKTSERMEEANLYVLAASTLTVQGKGKPVLGPDFEEFGFKYEGGVIANLYKKNIDRKEWIDYYSKSPGYYRIDDPDGSIWVASWIPEEHGVQKPQHMILCTPEEVRHISGKSSDG